MLLLREVPLTRVVRFVECARRAVEYLPPPPSEASIVGERRLWDVEVVVCGTRDARAARAARASRLAASRRARGGVTVLRPHCAVWCTRPDDESHLMRRLDTR